MNPYIVNDLEKLDGLKGLASQDVSMRRKLLSRLSADRGAQRFLLAPAGYGKTCLAASYGRLAFGPKRFWWVDASDPRFLFDLDAFAHGDSNQIKDTLESRRSSLIVFDAVPCLGSERKKVFGGVLQRAQSRGWEILVTSRDVSLGGACAYDRQHERQGASSSRRGNLGPTSHEGGNLASGDKALFRTSQGQGVLSAIGKPGFRLLFARDLLLDESEQADLMGGARRQLGLRISLAGVPSIAFSEERARVRFLTGLATGPFSLVEALSMVSLLLGPGKISDLDHFADRSDWEEDPRFSRDYPHAGIGTKGDRRSPLELTREEKLFLLASCGDSLANALFGGRGAIVPFAGEGVTGRVDGVRKRGDTALYLLRRRLVDCLVDAGDLSLAGRIIAASGDAVWARAFFDSWASRLLKECDPLAAMELARASDTNDASWEFLLMSALSHMGLGNKVGARDCLRKAQMLLASQRPSHEDSGQGPALALVELLLVLVDPDSVRERRTRVRELVVTLSTGEGVPECEMLSFVRRSAAIALSVEKDPKVLKQALEKGSLVPEGLSALVASLPVMDWLGSAPEGTEAAELISAVASCLQKQGAPEWQCFVLARFASRWLTGSIEEALGPVISRKGRFAQTKLAGQAATWKAQEPGEEVRFGVMVPSARIGGVRVSSANDAPSSKGKLRLFGGFDLRLPRSVDGEGGAQESSVEAHGVLLDSVTMRAKARILVGLLAANHGCEVSREWLGSALWPLVDRNSQRVSFYALWSYVNRAVRPYDCDTFLESTRYAAQFKDGVLDLDLVAVGRACERLESDDLSSGERLELLSQIRSNYRGPFMPGVEHPEIASIREAWERRVVDVVMGSIPTLKAAGELHVLEDYLSFAFGVDPSRQDLAVALMETQRALGRHAQATASFVRCRRASLEGHGIGVGSQLRDLYQEVLDDVA